MGRDQLPLFSSAGSGAGSKGEPRRWTVSEITSQIRGVLEPSFAQVWIQGEVSNCRPASSGHAYFSLKDAQASISAAAFGWNSRRRSFELKDGLQVLCRGKITVYPPRGTYQLSVDHIEPLGAGALQIAFEQLKEKLSAEGLFDSARKRPLPRFPRRVAIVTSPSGAAIQDMLNVLKRRAPQVSVLVIPALVQGDDAPRHLIRGIEVANRHGLGDVVALARGGGSIEDLWCFNDEHLARVIAGSELPVLSAVGHEIDFTISDFVADLRAPTPSAAAEILTGHWVDAAGRLRDAKARALHAIQRELQGRKQVLAHVSARLVSPKDRLREQAQKCDELQARLERAIRVRLERRRSSLEQLAGKLDAMSPLRVLERGYSILKDEQPGGGVVRSASQVLPGKRMRVIFHDGSATVQGV